MANEKESSAESFTHMTLCNNESEQIDVKVMFVNQDQEATRLLKSITGENSLPSRRLANIPMTSIKLNVPLPLKIEPKFAQVFPDAMLYIKHSKEPNLELRRFFDSYNILASFAGIQAGEELSLDFSKEPRLNGSLGSICISPSGSISSQETAVVGSRQTSTSSKTSSTPLTPTKESKQDVQEEEGQSAEEEALRPKAVEKENLLFPTINQFFAAKRSKSNVQGNRKVNDRDEPTISSSKVEPKSKGEAIENDNEPPQVPILAPTLALRAARRAPLRLTNNHESSWAAQDTPRAFTQEEEEENDRYAAQLYVNEGLAQNPFATNEDNENDGNENGSTAVPEVIVTAPDIAEDAEDDDTSSIITNPYSDDNLHITPGHSPEMGLLRQVMQRHTFSQPIEPRLGAVGDPVPDLELSIRDEIYEIFSGNLPPPRHNRVASGRVMAARSWAGSFDASVRQARRLCPSRATSWSQDNWNTPPPSALHSNTRSGPPPNAPRGPRDMRQPTMGNFSRQGVNIPVMQARDGRSFKAGQRPTQNGTFRSFSGPPVQGASGGRALLAQFLNASGAPSRLGQSSGLAGTFGSSPAPTQGPNGFRAPPGLGQRPTLIGTSTSASRPPDQAPNGGHRASSFTAQRPTQAGTTRSGPPISPPPNASTNWRQGAPRPSPVNTAAVPTHVSGRNQGQSSEYGRSRAATSKSWIKDKEAKKDSEKE